jgi:signal transduction histidine kinase
VRRIPEDLRTELTAAFQRYFERLFFCWAAVECLVVIPFFSARKLWSLAIVAVLLATFIALPRSLLHFGHVRSAVWTPAVSALVVLGWYTVVSGGIRSPAVVYQMAMIVATGLILGLRGTLLLAIPFITLDLGLAIYQATGGQLPVIFPGPPISSWFIILGAFVISASCVHLAVTRLGDALTERRKLISHQEEIREEERKRIAREIHDDLGSQLTALKLRLTRLSRDLASPAADVAAQVESLSQQVDDALKAVHGIATELRPAVLDLLGLKAALEWLAQEFHRSSGLPCTTEVDSVQIDATPGTAIFRVAQEALTNVTKHAQATQVRITLNDDGKAVALSVWDNGRGVRTEDLSKAGSFGLAGMRERAISMGGTFEIAPAPQGGTVLKLRLPHGNPATNGSPAQF